MERERKNSDGATWEKRKREKEEETDTFGTSKKTARSPDVKKNMDEEMKGMMKTMMEEMKRVREEMEEIRKESKEWRREVEAREMEWKKERETLRGRIDKLEEEIEKKERRERKNTIIIRGLNMKEGAERGQLEEWAKRSMGVKMEVKEATGITGKGIIIARLGRWEDKMEIMKNKAKLRDLEEKVYIDDDLTVKEREIQRQIREIAAEERKKGSSGEDSVQKNTDRGEIKKREGTVESNRGVRGSGGGGTQRVRRRERSSREKRGQAEE